MQGDSSTVVRQAAPDPAGRTGSEGGGQAWRGRRAGRRARLQPLLDHADRLLQDWLPGPACTDALQSWLASPAVQARHGADPGRHAVHIKPGRWVASAGRHWPAGLGTGNTPTMVTRRDLFYLAAATQAGASWIPLLAASFAWGQGTSGYGPARLQKIFKTNDPTDLDRSLTDAVDTLRSDGAVAAYRVLTRRVRHLGPAFFTKFLYAAGEGLAVGQPRPLILDKRVAVSMRTLAAHIYCRAGLPAEMADWLWTGSGWSTHRYDQYVQFTHRVNAHLHETLDGWPDRPDLLELALFDPQLRDVWGADA